MDLDLPFILSDETESELTETERSAVIAILLSMLGSSAQSSLTRTPTNWEVLGDIRALRNQAFPHQTLRGDE